MTIGSKNENEKWKVGITNPLNTEEVLAVVRFRKKTVVTSGNYERYFIKDNVRYHHILNPDTGYPTEERSYKYYNYNKKLYRCRCFIYCNLYIRKR